MTKLSVGPGTKQLSIGPGLLVVFYEERGEKWVEIASNYNLNCPVTPGVQRHVGNVFMPLAKFLEILDSAGLRKLASE